MKFRTRVAALAGWLLVFEMRWIDYAYHFPFVSANGEQ